MADYWGIEAIAHRMRCSTHTIYDWLRHRGFLMYKRKPARGRQSQWYTNDNLLTTWELTRCQQDTNTYRAARPARQAEYQARLRENSAQTSKENTSLRDTSPASDDPIGSDNRDYVNPHGQ